MSGKNIDAATVATVAASIAIKRVLDEAPDLIQHAVDVVNRNKTHNPEPWNRDGRIQIGFLPRKLLHDSGLPFTQSILWRAKKGNRLGEAWLVKPGSENKLFVEQYMQQCSVLLKTAKAKHPTPDVNQVWNWFGVMDGEINQVISKLGMKGWIYSPKPALQGQLLVGGEG